MACTVTGDFLAYLQIFASARRGGRAQEGRLVRVGLFRLAAFAGAAVTFFVAVWRNNAI